MVHCFQGERAGLDTGQVEGDVAEPCTAYRCDEGTPNLDGAGEFGQGDLDSGDLAVVAHPDIGETKRPHRLFRLVDLGQFLTGHLFEMRDARGQAGGCGFVRDSQAEVSGEMADHGLGQPGGSQRA